MFATIALGTAVPVDAGWTFAPIVLLALASYAGIYIWRWRISRAEGGARAAPVSKLVLWLTGVFCLFLALVSPIDRLGEEFASAHMIQHLLLADIVPICLILALTKHILRPATRRIQWFERSAGPLAHPAVGVIAYVAAMWFWHIPALYESALNHSFVHVIEHTTFFAAGLLYWWYLLSPIRSRMRLGGLGPVLYMASTKILVGFLGILLAFSPVVLFHYYEAGPGSTRWGLSALDDQRVAGLIMALEQSIVMRIALAYLFVRMLVESEEEDRRAERYDVV